MSKASRFFVGLIPLVGLITIWEVAVAISPQTAPIVSSPFRILLALPEIDFAKLALDFAVTLTEAGLGFALGTTSGTVIGMFLWFVPGAGRISSPYMIAFGAIPFFALAPMMIIWFGTGIFGKIMMSALTIVGISAFQAYQSTRDIHQDLMHLFVTLGFSRLGILKNLIFPSSLYWIFTSYKLSVGLAILGAVIGEFISSSHGLGYFILRSAGLFRVSSVWIGIFALMVVAFTLYGIIAFIQMQASKHLKGHSYVDTFRSNLVSPDKV